MSISTELIACFITTSIFAVVFSAILFLVFWPKLKIIAKHKRYVTQLNDYFIIQRPFWFQNLALLRYHPVRYIHISPRKGIRARNKTLLKGKVIRELIFAGIEAIDMLPTNYTYIASTHSVIVKQLMKLEHDNKIVILSNKKGILVVPARYAQKVIFGTADKSHWWNGYIVIFQKISK